PVAHDCVSVSAKLSFIGTVNCCNRHLDRRTIQRDCLYWNRHAALVDAVVDCLVCTVICFRDLKDDTKIPTGMECALPGVRDTFRRVRSSGLSADMRDVHESEDDRHPNRSDRSPAQQQLTAEV